MIIKIALFILYSIVSTSCQAGGPSIEGHGRGFLQRVRNTSAYPISFAQSKTILDYLPNGTVIRIKSLRKEYGLSGRYYAARRIVGAYRLEADTLDPDDLATHFVVKRFVARDFSEYIGIYSNMAEGKFMRSDESRSVTFSMPDMMDEKLAEGHWSIIPATGETGAIDNQKFLDPEFASNIFNNCYLKARASGVMQSRGIPQNYEGTNSAPISKSSNSILLGTASSQATKDTPDGGTNPSEKIPPTGILIVDPLEAEVAKPSPTAQGTPTIISQEKCAAICFAKTVVVISKRGTAMREKPDGGWENLDQGLNGASLVSIGAATDGTMWSCDANNNVWAYSTTENKWNKVLLAPSTGVITKVILASANQVWALSQDGTIFQKLGDNSNAIWQPPSDHKGTNNVKDFCITQNGTIFTICSDNKIYKGSPNGTSYNFEQFSTPQDLLNTIPYSITAESKDFVAFSTPADEVYILVSGKTGNTTDSWKKLALKGTNTPIKLRNITTQKNGSIAGIVSNSGQADDNTVVAINNITTI